MVSTSRRTTTRSGRFWETLLEHTQDPDFVVSGWPRDGCPAGIGEWIIGKRHVPTNVRTVFGYSCGTGLLRVSGTSRASLYTDSSNIAADEITRIERKGFVETFTEQVAVASKVALLLKTREDGTTKVRLIIDLRRSGGNGGVELPSVLSCRACQTSPTASSI